MVSSSTFANRNRKAPAITARGACPMLRTETGAVARVLQCLDAKQRFASRLKLQSAKEAAVTSAEHVNRPYLGVRDPISP